MANKKEKYTIDDGANLNNDSPKVDVRERTPRMVAPADNAEPVDANAHTRWVREDPRRIREMELKGYQIAKEEDVKPNHDGKKFEDGAIHKGDLILMITSREGVEEREKARINELKAMERGSRPDEEALYADKEENYRIHRGKKYFIP